MGTRNLICVVLNGEYKVAQYGQWDGYPSGQGSVVLEFLRDEMDRENFISRLKDCRYISEEEHTALWEAAGAGAGGFVNMNVSDKFKEHNPQLHRDFGAQVLAHIQDSTGEVLLKDSIDFAQESLFCEWAYVIDLDKNVLEVYKGFNTEKVPASNRFQGKPTPPREDADYAYTPVLLQGSYSLYDLPTEKQFVADYEDSNEDEDDTDINLEPMIKDEVLAVIDRIRSGNAGHDQITERICNYIEANVDEFIDCYESE